MRSLARRLALLPVLVAGVLVAPLSAHAATSAHAPVPAKADAPELTLQLRDLFVNRNELGFFDRLTATAILARPSDGMQDPQGEGYARPSGKLCNRRICVHYVPAGKDAPRSRHWLRHTLRTVSGVWHHEVDVLGFRPPPSDGKHGGDGRFDVYLTDLGSRGLFGYCAPEARVKGERFSAYGYCVLDNDFARSQYDAKPQVSLEVTAAHEFFHAIQFGYDYRADPWLMESTAVWMEESYADSANDNRRYLPYGSEARPWVSLDHYTDTGYAQYGNWAFWQFLTDRYGRGLIRQVWDRVDATRGAPGEASIPALSRVLDRRTHTSTGLADALTAYAVANLDPTASYPEGDAWPSARLDSRMRLRRERGRRAVTVRVDHLAAQDVAFRPPTTGASRRLLLTVEGPSRRTRVVVTVRRDDGHSTHLPLTLRHGVGTATVAFSPKRVASVVVTVVNTSARYDCGRGTLMSCGGTPRDDGMRFTVSARSIPPRPAHHGHHGRQRHRDHR